LSVLGEHERCDRIAGGGVGLCLHRRVSSVVVDARTSSPMPIRFYMFFNDSRFFFLPKT
jgi:hypothetical protein